MRTSEYIADGSDRYLWAYNGERDKSVASLESASKRGTTVLQKGLWQVYNSTLFY